MRAAVYYGPGDVRIESVPDPAPPGPGELILQVTRAGICGSDASEYVDGPHFIPLTKRHPGSGHVGPLILGHEFTGRVVAAGPGAGPFQIGQRVIPGTGIWCEQCAWCQAGRSNLCARYYTLGLHAAGGLAEYANVPARVCQLVPDACGDDAAAMAQPLSVALHALRRSGAQPGQAVAFVGAGAIGSFMIAAAHARGLAPLIAVDVDDERLATARQLGADHLIDTRGQDVVAALRDLTGGDGPDVVIEASGTPKAPTMALEAVRRGGRVLLVGLQSEPRALDLFAMSVREIELTTTLAHVAEVDLPEAIDILTTTSLASVVLDRVIGLEALVPDGLLALAERRARGKILIDPQRA